MAFNLVAGNDKATALRRYKMNKKWAANFDTPTGFPSGSSQAAKILDTIQELESKYPEFNPDSGAPVQHQPVVQPAAPVAVVTASKGQMLDRYECLLKMAKDFPDRVADRLETLEENYYNKFGVDIDDDYKKKQLKKQQNGSSSPAPQVTSVDQGQGEVVEVGNENAQIQRYKMLRRLEQEPPIGEGRSLQATNSLSDLKPQVLKIFEQRVGKIGVYMDKKIQYYKAQSKKIRTELRMPQFNSSEYNNLPGGHDRDTLNSFGQEQRTQYLRGHLRAAAKKQADRENNNGAWTGNSNMASPDDDDTDVDGDDWESDSDWEEPDYDTHEVSSYGKLGNNAKPPPFQSRNPTTSDSPVFNSPTPQWFSAQKRKQDNENYLARECGDGRRHASAPHNSRQLLFSQANRSTSPWF
jgi:hypothetical protein